MHALRYDNGFRDTVRRIHDGALGDIVALQANDLRGPIWRRERLPDETDMHWQIRNWYYYTWLSDDFNVEQHVHYLDVCAWIMRDTYPVRCYGTGGRQVRTGAEFGNIYDHFSITYEYENGVKFFSTCRQQAGCRNDMSAHVMGSRGTGQFTERRRGLILRTAGNEHVYEGPTNTMMVAEHEATARGRNGHALGRKNAEPRSSHNATTLSPAVTLNCSISTKPLPSRSTGAGKSDHPSTT